MSESSSGLGAPRWARITGIALAAMLLTGLFVVWGFPYDRLALLVAQRLGENTGIDLTVGQVEARMSLGGPGLGAEGVRARTRDGSVWNIDEMFVRPAWSLSWLRARPALFLDVRSESGEIEGVTRFAADGGGFSGEVRNLDLAELRLGTFVQGLELSGRADVSADVEFGESGADGPIALSAREGTLAHPGLPMAVPYETLEGDLSLGGESLLEIRQLAIRSSLGTGTVQGTVGQAGPRGSPPLDLAIDVTAAKNIRALLESQGMRFDREGNLHLQVSGTAARPVVR